MKLTVICVLFALSKIVKGAFWFAAVQPVLLGFGAILTAINQDVLDLESIQLKHWLPFINKQSETKSKNEEVEDEPETMHDELGIDKEWDKPYAPWPDMYPGSRDKPLWVDAGPGIPTGWDINWDGEGDSTMTS